MKKVNTAIKQHFKVRFIIEYSQHINKHLKEIGIGSQEYIQSAKN